MKAVKLIAVFCVFALVFGAFASCANKPNDTTTTAGTTAPVKSETNVSLSVLKGPTGMGASRLMARADSKETNGTYTVKLESAPDVVVADLLAGKTDIAAIPTTSAATLYNKTQGKIKILGVSTLSVLYIVEKGEAVSDVKALKGKTIVTSGKGTNVEYVLNYILEKNDLTPGTDVTINFLSEHAEVVTQAKAGKADIALLPEPFVTQLLAGENSGYRRALDFKEEWAKVSDKNLPMGVIAARADFVAENPNAVAAFMADYTESVAFVNHTANTDAAAKLIGERGILPEAVAKKAIAASNIVFVTGEEMKGIVADFFAKMHAANPKVIGGALPGDDIYFI